MNALPVGLLRLRTKAFFWCPSLQGELAIPYTVVLIGPKCFQACSGFTSVVFHTPSQFRRKLGRCVFAYCRDLQSVTTTKYRIDSEKNFLWLYLVNGMSATVIFDGNRRGCFFPLHFVAIGQSSGTDHADWCSCVRGVSILGASYNPYDRRGRVILTRYRVVLWEISCSLPGRPYRTITINIGTNVRANRIPNKSPATRHGIFNLGRTRDGSISVRPYGSVQMVPTYNI